MGSSNNVKLWLHEDILDGTETAAWFFDEIEAMCMESHIKHSSNPIECFVPGAFAGTIALSTGDGAPEMDMPDTGTYTVHPRYGRGFRFTGAGFHLSSNSTLATAQSANGTGYDIDPELVADTGITDGPAELDSSSHIAMFTVFSRDAGNPGTQMHIEFKKQSSSDTSKTLIKYSFYSKDDGTVGYRHTTTTGGSYYELLSAPGTIVMGQAYDALIVRDDTAKTVTIQVNGIQVASGSYSGQDVVDVTDGSYHTAVFLVGGRGTRSVEAGFDRFVGQMMNVRVWGPQAVPGVSYDVGDIYDVYTRARSSTIWYEVKHYTKLKFSHFMNAPNRLKCVILTNEQRSLDRFMTSNRAFRITREDSTNGLDGTNVLDGWIDDLDNDDKAVVYDDPTDPDVARFVVWQANGGDMAYRAMRFKQQVDPDETVSYSSGQPFTGSTSIILDGFSYPAQPQTILDALLPAQIMADVRAGGGFGTSNYNRYPSVLLETQRIGNHTYTYPITRQSETPAHVVTVNAKNEDVFTIGVQLATIGRYSLPPVTTPIADARFVDYCEVVADRFMRPILCYRACNDSTFYSQETDPGAIVASRTIDTYTDSVGTQVQFQHNRIVNQVEVRYGALPSPTTNANRTGFKRDALSASKNGNAQYVTSLPYVRSLETAQKAQATILNLYSGTVNNNTLTRITTKFGSVYSNGSNSGTFGANLGDFVRYIRSDGTSIVDRFLGFGYDQDQESLTLQLGLPGASEERNEAGQKANILASKTTRGLYG